MILFPPIITSFFNKGKIIRVVVEKINGIPGRPSVVLFVEIRSKT